MPRPSPVFYHQCNPASVPYAAIPLLDPKMLFDRGDALKSVINFLSVSGDVGHARFQFLDIAPNVREFCADFSEILSRLVPKIIKLLRNDFSSLFVAPSSSFVAMCSTT
jgi:hypothetical protein